jgi:O-glycosyl hydrolase
MTRTYAYIILLIFSSVVSHLSYGQAKGNANTVSIQVDGATRFQQVDGFGVNANTRAWDGKELEPALNLLLDSANATIWRVIVETVYNWEDKNDNNDPFSFNWDYYNALYETPKYQKAWDMIAYLNKRGITKNLMINFMGPVPLWMGGKVVKEKYEDEYIEMLVSFFYYARKTKHLQIGLISIMNEPDIENEGPTVNAKQYVKLQRKFINRMDSLGMGDIRYVSPDVAGMNNGLNTYIPELMKDPVVMQKMAHVGLHSYGGYYINVDSALKHSAYPKTDYWMTEWNNWCNGCDDGILGEYNYAFAAKSIGYLFEFLQHGATAGIIWEGYDSYYEHHAPSPFSYWGILAYEPATKTYTVRKNYYAFQQVAKFVLPGSFRVAVSNQSDSVTILSFYNEAAKKISITGINKTHHPINLSATLNNLPAVTGFESWVTNETENMKPGGAVKIKGKTFTTTIPADCIFTLASD